MGEIPDDIKDRARTLLRSNWTVLQVMHDTGLTLQQVNGVWTGMKTKGWVPQGAKPGRLIQPGRPGGRAGEQASWQAMNPTTSGPLVSPSELAPSAGTTSQPGRPAAVIAAPGPVRFQSLVQSQHSGFPPSQAFVESYPLVRNPPLEELVSAHKVAKRRYDDWYAPLWREEERWLVHDLRRAYLRSRLAENERALEEAMRRDRAEPETRDNSRRIEASILLLDLIQASAMMVKNGLDPRVAAKRFGDVVDMYAILSCTNP